MIGSVCVWPPMVCHLMTTDFSRHLLVERFVEWLCFNDFFLLIILSRLVSRCCLLQCWWFCTCRLHYTMKPWQRSLSGVIISHFLLCWGHTVVIRWWFWVSAHNEIHLLLRSHLEFRQYTLLLVVLTFLFNRPFQMLLQVRPAVHKEKLYHFAWLKTGHPTLVATSRSLVQSRRSDSVTSRKILKLDANSCFLAHFQPEN